MIFAGVITVAIILTVLFFIFNKDKKPDNDNYVEPYDVSMSSQEDEIEIDDTPERLKMPKKSEYNGKYDRYYERKNGQNQSG